MELLSVKVKKGRLDKAADTVKTYVVLKVQNVKSATIDRRGSDPCWEQDFMFEIGADAKGFIIELWKKGLLWDSILGVLWIPLATVQHATDEGPGTWWTLHSEVIKKGSDIQGTKTPTSHEILLDVYLALPFDTHKDADGRGWHGGTRRSHRGTRDGLSAAGGGLSIQESQLRRNKDQADGGNFAKARWARAIQKILQEDTCNRGRFAGLTESLQDLGWNKRMCHFLVFSFSLSNDQ